MKTELLREYRKSPTKFREILETARYTDVDRSELIGHLCYLGDDENRATHYWMVRGTILATVLGVTTLVSLFEANETSIIYVGLGCAGMLVSLGMILPLVREAGSFWFYPLGRSYSDLRTEALENMKQHEKNIF